MIGLLGQRYLGQLATFYFPLPATLSDISLTQKEYRFSDIAFHIPSVERNFQGSRVCLDQGMGTYLTHIDI